LSAGVTGVGRRRSQRWPRPQIHRQSARGERYAAGQPHVEQRRSLWHAFFFAVPVAPTTLASCYARGDAQQWGGLDYSGNSRSTAGAA